MLYPLLLYVTLLLISQLLKFHFFCSLALPFECALFPRWIEGLHSPDWNLSFQRLKLFNRWNEYLPLFMFPMLLIISAVSFFFFSRFSPFLIVMVFPLFIGLSPFYFPSLLYSYCILLPFPFCLLLFFYLYSYIFTYNTLVLLFLSCPPCGGSFYLMPLFCLYIICVFSFFHCFI